MLRIRILAGWLAIVVSYSAVTAEGQRVQFPSPVPGSGDVGGSGTVVAQSPMAPAPMASAPPPTAPVGPAPLAAPPAVMPPVGAPPAGAPTATFGGTVQSPPTWDPYSSGPATTTPIAPSYTPPPVGAAGQPPALYPGGAPWGTGNSYAYTQPTFPTTTNRRFLQEMRFETTWLPGTGGDNKFGVGGLELFGTFACPLFGNIETPLLITPGFALGMLSGPVTTPENQADMPPTLYDAYFDFAWGPKITPWLAADLGLRVGAYSDFSYFDSSTIRLMGRGIGVITFTPTTQISLGVIYLDRNSVKALPAGGLIWTPNPNRRWEIVFPNPKFANRLQDLGTTEMWWYVSGEYGGGAWAITRADLEFLDRKGQRESVDYNDIRVILGLEWTALSGRNGFCEIGYVWNREIVYASGIPVNYNPSETVMLRGGVSF